MALKIHLNMMLLFDVCFLVCGHSDGMPGSVLGGVSAERDNKGSYFQLKHFKHLLFNISSTSDSADQ